MAQQRTQLKRDMDQINKIELQNMLEQALQVNNPSKQWFADIIKRQLGILASIAQKQQEQGQDVPAEIRAVLDPKALVRRGGGKKSCFRVSTGRKGSKAPKGLPDPGCVKLNSFVLNPTGKTGGDGKYYISVKGPGGRRKWEKAAVSPEIIEQLKSKSATSSFGSEVPDDDSDSGN